jgi:hypothetical protein
MQRKQRIPGLLLLLEAQLHIILSPESKPQSLYPSLKGKGDAATVTLTNFGTALQYVPVSSRCPH